MSFKHLSLQEREFLFAWDSLNLSYREMARRLCRDPKSIRDEFERNTKYGKKYIPCLAQKRADRISKLQRSKAPLKRLDIYLYVREHLRYPHFWTPEMISGRIPKDIKGASISIEAIYQYIYSAKARKDKLWRFLPSGRKKRKKKLGRKVRNNGKIPDAISIDLRPKSINKRKTPGHWESDNIQGPKSSKPALSVVVERSVRHINIKKVLNQSSDQKVLATRKHFSDIPIQLRRSITQDNGSENVQHKLISNEFGFNMFFCHAYHSWEKGSVENRNKIIRRFFPKGTDFSSVSVQQIQFVQDVINNMPLRCLNFNTPSEKMSKLVSKFNSS